MDSLVKGVTIKPRLAIYPSTHDTPVTPVAKNQPRHFHTISHLFGMFVERDPRIDIRQCYMLLSWRRR